ncbi:hypothetical protein AB6A23_06600 [Paenibacillus tarimensis]
MAGKKQIKPTVVENSTEVFKNGYQSALHYVQNAVENAVGTTEDATQNLVNNVMKKGRK